MAQDMMTDEQTNELTGLTLAYIGDAVFELMMRMHHLSAPKHDNGSMHKSVAGYVSAEAQSKWADILLPLLDEEETHAYMRGRNAKLSVSKKKSPIANHKASGFEALVGWLYLTGRRERLEELIKIIFN